MLSTSIIILGLVLQIQHAVSAEEKVTIAGMVTSVLRQHIMLIKLFAGKEG